MFVVVTGELVTLEFADHGLPQSRVRQPSQDGDLTWHVLALPEPSG